MLMPIIMSMVMYEKENRLREVMKMMGLKMSVYWSVTYVLFLAEYAIVVLVFWIVGAFAKINFFTMHSPVILFLYLFLWGNNLVAFSMFLTVFFSKTRTATAVGFILIFAFVFGGYMVFETLSSDPNTSESAYYAYQWLPPMAFMRATVFIVNASYRIFPITLANWGSTPLPELFGWLIVEWFLCLALMYYFEKVLSVGYGVRSHPCFCLQGRFWGTQAGKRGKSGDGMELRVGSGGQKEDLA